MRSFARPFAALALVGIVASACGGATATATPALTSAPAATPDPTSAPAPASTPVPTPTPVPSTDGEGAEYVAGFEVHSGTGGTEVQVGDVTQTRGVLITGRFTMNDPRVSGTGTGLINIDAHGVVGPEWGTTRLENAGGAWEGTVAGASWDNGESSDLSGWLVGSGGYEGYTYYWHIRTSGIYGTVEGIIYPGPPPAP
jgi:hypothetical protein